VQNTVDNSRIEQPKTLGPVWIRPEPPVGTVVDECPYFSSLLGDEDDLPVGMAGRKLAQGLGGLGEGIGAGYPNGDRAGFR